MNSVPTMENRGFMNLQLSAQALWFHLSARAREYGDRWAVSAWEATAVRREIGAAPEDVQALIRNRFVTVKNEMVYINEEVEWMPGPVVERDGEEQVLFVYPGSRMVYWRESMEKYRRQQAEDERKRAERRRVAIY